MCLGLRRRVEEWGGIEGTECGLNSVLLELAHCSRYLVGYTADNHSTTNELPHRTSQLSNRLIERRAAAGASSTACRAHRGLFTLRYHRR